MIASPMPKALVIALSLGITLLTLPLDSLAAKESSADKDARKAAKAADKETAKTAKVAKKASKSSSHSSVKTIEAVTTKSSSDEQVIREQIARIGKGIAAASHNGIASIWTADGTFIDSDGAMYRGRGALEAHFAAVFAEDGKGYFDLLPDNIRLISDNVALSEGIVRRLNGIAGPTPETRYSMVFLKQNGSWLISSASETPLVAQAGPTETVKDPLKQLSWMVGEWSAENNGGSVRMKSEWDPNKNFILSTYEMKKSADAPVLHSKQIIGWDPRRNQFVSWHFDSNGGFGYGNWIKENGQWLVESSGVERDGSSFTSVNIIAPKDQNAFTWQGVNRSVNGIAVSDTNQLKVNRIGNLTSSIEK